MAAAGLSTKATQSESVWNMHQAWYASAHCKKNGESTNDYYAHQSKHYEAHREEEDYPQLWEEIYKSDIMRTQKNIPWKSVLNLLYEHQYVIINWPAGVDAVGPNFNVKSLTADELRTLTVPFLKEQMGVDYFAEGLGDDDEGTGQVVPTPKSFFYLQHWTTEQAQLFCRADPKIFNIPLVINTDNCSLHILSNLQKFLNGVLKHMLPKPQEGASSASSLPPSSPPVGEESPVQGHAPMNVATIRHAHHPSLAASRHSSPPSSATAEQLQPSAQRHGSVNMAAIHHGHCPQAGSHHSTAPSPTAHSPPLPFARGHVPSHISLTSHLPTVQYALAAQPHAPSTTTGCSLTSVIGNIQKMEVMTVHMHKAELITVLLNMSIKSLHARGVMTIIRMTKVTILVVMCLLSVPPQVKLCQ
ncbi:hypothetical protein SCLCIDRAFT_24139 [Scleroderma citrinum Foug A]|uniref:Uncharacterized protein n=1 Tax=Scleroderma citrinum Foug A TaxID=1036808 RepID=A0A0C2ZPH7_9AGAM|nr:hypothetical protein SCLCIDRAFT_24139 [Scleroderma citrinum Foug A]